MEWFAVKTLYRSTPSGKPRGRDKKYRSGIAALEERMVLFRAKDGASAIRKAMAEARKYAKSNPCTNVYGQKVTTVALEFAEAYEMFDEPADGAEIFSFIQIIPARLSESAIIQRVDIGVWKVVFWGHYKKS